MIILIIYTAIDNDKGKLGGMVTVIKSQSF